MDSKKASLEAPDEKASLGPIYATLQSSTLQFEARCERTEKWLPHEHVVIYPREQENYLMEKLKHPKYKFYKVFPSKNDLWVHIPCGYWLENGLLVSKEFSDNEPDKRVAAYFGTEKEIRSRGRCIHFILHGSYSFLPQIHPACTCSKNTCSENTCSENTCSKNSDI
jgi:hypothetical protein